MDDDQKAAVVVAAGAAARLSAALGGAEVTLTVPVDGETAEALAAQITAGMAGGPAPGWHVQSVTVAARPPEPVAFRVTVRGARPLADVDAAPVHHRS